LPIFVLSLELGKSVWRHVHAAKVLVMQTSLKGRQITADLRVERVFDSYQLRRAYQGVLTALRRYWLAQSLLIRGL